MTTTLPKEMYDAAVNIFTRRMEVDTTNYGSSSFSSLVYFPPVSLVPSCSDTSRLLTRQECEKKTNMFSWHTIERVSFEDTKQSDQLRNMRIAQSHTIIDSLKNGESFVGALARAATIVGSESNIPPSISVECRKSAPTNSPLSSPLPVVGPMNTSPIATLVTQTIVPTSNNVKEQNPLMQADSVIVKKEDKSSISSFSNTSCKGTGGKAMMTNFFGKKTTNITGNKAPTLHTPSVVLTVAQEENTDAVDTVPSGNKRAREEGNEDPHTPQVGEDHIDRHVVHEFDQLPPAATKTPRVEISFNKEEITVGEQNTETKSSITATASDTIVVHNEEEEEKKLLSCSTNVIAAKAPHYSSLNDDLIVHHETDAAPNSPAKDCFETMMTGSHTNQTQCSGNNRKKTSSAIGFPENTNKCNIIGKYFNPELVAFQKQFEKRTKSVVKELPSGELEFRELSYRVIVRQDQGGDVVEEELTDEEYNQKCAAFMAIINNRQINCSTTTTQCSPNSETETNITRVDDSIGRSSQSCANGKKNPDLRKSTTVDARKNTISGMWSNKNIKSITS